jgi:ATP synthase I chain
VTDGPARGILRASTVTAALAVLALGTLGRFRPALALTLGAVVAIVSARWLSHVVGRLQVAGAEEGRKPGWKFALGAGLRYLFVGLAVYGAVRLVPAEPFWLLAGLSTVVVGVGVEGARDLWRERRHGRTVPSAGNDRA